MINPVFDLVRKIKLPLAYPLLNIVNGRLISIYTSMQPSMTQDKLKAKQPLWVNSNAQ